MGRLEGKIGIVTGAGSGMGRAIALAMAKEGAKVVVNDRRTDGEGEKTVDMIKKGGGEAIYIQADISEAKSVENIIGTTLKTYGKLDILVNNAGAQRYRPLEELTEADFDFIVSTNFKGTWMAMKYALPEMKKVGKGSIINIASIAADHAQTGSAIYGGSKGAVLSMTRVAAIEFAPYNIRVNAVQPGCIVTGMSSEIVTEQPQLKARIDRETALQHRFGIPEEVAPIVVFLASDESGFITGQKIAVDGGISADSHIV